MLIMSIFIAWIDYIFFPCTSNLHYFFITFSCVSDFLYFVIVSSTNIIFLFALFCSFPHLFVFRWFRSFCNSLILSMQSIWSVQSFFMSMTSSPMWYIFCKLFQIASAWSFSVSQLLIYYSFLCSWSS